MFLGRTNQNQKHANSTEGALPPLTITEIQLSKRMKYFQRTVKIFVVLLVVAGATVAFVYLGTYLQKTGVLQKIKDLGWPSYVVMTAIVFATSFPVPGYALFVIACGFLFGFPLGFVPAYIGSVTGAIAAYWCGRRFLRNWATKQLGKYPKIAAIEKAVLDNNGFKIALLIRLAPYPYGVLNIIFGVSSLKFPHFVGCTALSCLKLFAHIYFGSIARDLTDLSKWSTADTISVAVGGVVSIAVLISISIIANRELRRFQQQQQQQPQPLIHEGEEEEQGEEDTRKRSTNSLTRTTHKVLQAPEQQSLLPHSVNSEHDAPVVVALS